MATFSFGQTVAAGAAPGTSLAFGAAQPATTGTTAFGAQPSAAGTAFGTQPTFGAGASAFGAAGTAAATFGQPAPTNTFGTSFGANKPSFGGNFATGFGATNTINASKPQAAQLSQQDLYMTPEDHAKRLAMELQKQAGQFQEIADKILTQDKQNYDIYQQLEQFSLLLDQLNDRQTQQRQQITQIAATQKQLYQELSAKPKTTDSKLAHIARMMVEVEAEIEQVSAGSVGVLRDIQEQTVVLEHLSAMSQ